MKKSIQHGLLGVTLVIAGALASVAPFGQTSAQTATATTGTDGTATQTTTDVQTSLEEILEEPEAADAYRYDPQGRRDPFRSLIGPTPRIDAGQRPEGLPGFLIDELKLQGIFRTRQGFTAMFNAPDNKGYSVRVGDKVLDGEIVRITATSVVFRQEVNDPTRIERYREVVKDLTPAAGRR